MAELTFMTGRGSDRSLVRPLDMRRDSEPRQETTQEILDRVLPLYPDLVSPHASETERQSPTRGAQVAAVSVGFRPARDGGPRVERGQSVGNGVPVVHCYG